MADPSLATRGELATRGAECVLAAGTLARLASKAASSPALQSTIASFAEHEQAIESTSEMLHRVNEGMVALDEALEDMSASLKLEDRPNPAAAARES